MAWALYGLGYDLSYSPHYTHIEPCPATQPGALIDPFGLQRQCPSLHFRGVASPTREAEDLSPQPVVGENATPSTLTLPAAASHLLIILHQAGDQRENFRELVANGSRKRQGGSFELQSLRPHVSQRFETFCCGLWHDGRKNICFNPEGLLFRVRYGIRFVSV